MTLVEIFLCPEHIYAGHFNQAPGDTPMTRVDAAQFVAGAGIVGDRYFDRPSGHKGQVTFFAEETWLRLRGEFPQVASGPDVFRRNLIVRGADLLALVGREFSLQGVRFRGVEHCRPCAWMDLAFAPGTRDRLADWQAGGLRAEILSDGWIRSPES